MKYNVFHLFSCMVPGVVNVFVCVLQVRLEQRTDEEALHSSEMKKQELLNKKQQLNEQRWRACVCILCTLLLSVYFHTGLNMSNA